MGRFNSSATRVVPVFDRLYDRDPTGGEWLPYLIGAASRATDVSIPAHLGELFPQHPRWWGANERRLQPPPDLLKWLVRNVSIAQVEASGDKDPVRAKRLALARGDADAIAAAIKGIDCGSWSRQWYVLEGPSAPDAFFETESILLVVEGKRTEYACTTKTKWMPRRSQLLRHMDAALEIAEGRDVYGLLIVEGHDSRPLELDNWWVDQVNAQVSQELVDRSLPHRSAEQKRRVVNGVLGGITWQRVCSDLGIPWPPDGIAV
jgi:hypothetical protein